MSDGWAGRLIEGATFGQRDLGATLQAYHPWQAERWGWLRDSMVHLQWV